MGVDRQHAYEPWGPDAQSGRGGIGWSAKDSNSEVVVRCNLGGRDLADGGEVLCAYRSPKRRRLAVFVDGEGREAASALARSSIDVLARVLLVEEVVREPASNLTGSGMIGEVSPAGFGMSLAV